MRYYKKIALRAALFPLRLLPIKKDLVMFNNNLTLNYTGNPKYISEYLLRNNSDQVNLVFSVKDPRKYKNYDSRIKFVKYNSLDYFINIMTCKVFVTNSGGHSYVPLRKKQVVINTHHGGGAYKKIGRYVYGDTPVFRKDLKLSSKQTTVFLSSSRKFTEVVSDSLLLPREIFWEIGMPRNDMLIDQDNGLRRKIRSELGLKDRERLVLYAPTYRKQEDDYFKDSVPIIYGIDADRVCRALSERFGGDWIFGSRMHPSINKEVRIVGEKVIDLSKYEEMQELLLAADVMINDFSSSMWDFMLTGKPIFIFAADMDHYIATTDLETPLNELPFPRSTDNNELEEAILNFDEQKYRDDCEKHYKALGGCETGKATEKTADYIMRQIIGS